MVKLRRWSSYSSDQLKQFSLYDMAHAVNITHLPNGTDHYGALYYVTCRMNSITSLQQL